MSAYKINLVVISGQGWSMDQIWPQIRNLRIILPLEPSHYEKSKMTYLQALENRKCKNRKFKNRLGEN